ncbi:MAG: cbb3-type cytochrome oxidase assembly protein CcoS [Bacteroidia bacterium]
MSVIIVLLIASVTVAGGFLAAYLWSVKNGQYDDIDSPATRILIENHLAKDENLAKKK